MRTIEIKVYQFNELNKQAKEKAREWYRNGALDYNWWGCVYDEFKEQAEDVGFGIKSMYFSGFWSQGDGAMFEYDSIDDRLRLQFIETLNLSPMRKQWLINNTMISGRGKQSGNYYHERSCDHSIYWEIDNGSLHWDKTFYKWLDSFYGDFEKYVTDIYIDLC